MLEIIYAWLENLAFFMVLTVVVIQLIPNENYKKYVRFYIGLILILMMMGPLMKIMNMEGYQKNAYLNELKRIEKLTKEMEETIGE